MPKPSREGKSSQVGKVSRPGRPTRTVRREDTDEGGAGGGRGAAGPQSPEDDGDERKKPSAATDYRLAGLSLTVKVALGGIAATALAALTLVIAAFSGARGEVDTEINHAGKRLVKMLASIDIKLWTEILQQPLQRKLQSNMDESAAKISAIFRGFETEDPDLKRKLDQIREELTATFKHTTALLNATTLSNPMERMGKAELAKATGLEIPAVLDIIVFKFGAGDPEPLTSLGFFGGRGRVGLGKEELVEEEAATGLVIKRSSYSATGKPIPVRTFRQPVKDNAGKAEGEVLLILSAERIDEVQGRLLGAFLLPAVIAVGVGAGIGFLIARTVVKPVKTLLGDIHAVSQGDLAHKTQSHSTDEIGLLARAFHSMTVSLKSAHEADMATKALEHELSIASEIQSNLLPKRIPRLPGYDIGAFYRPSKEVGGDYYDFIQIDQEHIGIVVADVSGKGIPGSMVMTMARTLLRTEAERSLSTAATLVQTNRILARDIRRGMFVTAMYMILDARNRTLLVSSAGHNPLIVVRTDPKTHKKVNELVNPGGIALGFDKGPVFERTIKEQLVTLCPGDRICAYTDGVVESMSPQDEEFGDDKFYDMCVALSEKTSNEFITVVVDALDQHQSTGPQHDDITLVTVRLLPL